ncbi:MAG: CDP-diacylglycerol--glycerol-3-phosphate 3-phosphatidyltransferase [Acidimicrobiales bacterium]|nr:CDP-diacylglycerol--glycerol-3-phosphate 3-phosphatidyltransferase [Acidimicrobiales bacterium]
MSSSFGPSALATPANLVTVLRLMLSPLLFGLVAEGPSWLAVSLWFVLSASDFVDGYLARRHGTTRSGAFLDPLADKVLVLGAMVALVVNGTFWWVPVAIIGVREVAISVYRTWVGRRGVSVPARRLAKLKTLVQQLAVGFALLPLTADARWLWQPLLWASVVLAVVSGAQYVVGAGRSHAEPRTDPPLGAAGAV